jgi:excisionase family DNA binding protein
MDNPNELLTSEEVAALLRIDVRTVRKYHAEGRLKAEKYSARVFRYRRSDVEAFREKCREMIKA